MATPEPKVVQPLVTASPNPTRTANRPRQRKPNYAKLHSKPLPLTVHPLPAFLPQNPLSLLRIAYALIQSLVNPPSSHSGHLCRGTFSAETSSIHVTDPAHIRVLWEYGFFGKGTLSRSEPSWLSREKARVIAGPGKSSEEVTNKRREDRRLFKLERARAEREEIERQLQQERKGDKEKSSAPVAEDKSGDLSHVFPWLASEGEVPVSEPSTIENTVDGAEHALGDVATAPVSAQSTLPEPIKPAITPDQIDIRDQEHLQLTPEEAFFLSWGLGALDIQNASKAATPAATPLSALEQLQLYLSHATCPVQPLALALKADNQFLLNYVVYHHFRSLGWVVRPGSKFATDYLLYVRGPVFSHAEFAVMILPEYAETDAQYERRRDWWWLHCVNRVQTQVRKSLVLVYVKVPEDDAVEQMVQRGDVKGLFGLYAVREFVLKRWSANRSRD